MKKIFLFTLLFIFSTAVGAYAQLEVAKSGGKQIIKSTKALKETTTNLERRGFALSKEGSNEVLLSPNPGGFTQSPYVDYQAKQELSNTSTKVSRSFLEQMKRDRKARQLKAQHKRETDLYFAKENLPKLQPNESFFTTDLSPFTPNREIRAEKIELPVIAEPNVLYRGLALDGEGKSIANILDNGLRVQDAGDESTTLTTAYASHSQVASHVIATANTKVTNLTSSPQGAVYWLYKRLTPELQVPVLVQVYGVEGEGSLVVENKDIPAENVNVLAKLKINDQARWCLIERASEEGQIGFKITPFEYVLKVK